MSAPVSRLWMLNDHTRVPPSRALPVGYSVRGMRDAADIAAWVSIWREAHPGLDVDAARFHRAFGHDAVLVAQRCLLLADASGHPVGVGAAWFDPDYHGAPAGRVHWLAVLPSHQGRGLGAALLGAVLDLLRQHHARSYLVTQSDRLEAIRLYLRHGFLPHPITPTDRQSWRALADLGFTESLK